MSQSASPDLAELRKSCGKKTLQAVAGFLSGFALLAFLIDNREAVWSITVFCLTLGGNFWCGVLTSVSLAGVLAWLMCIYGKLPEDSTASKALDWQIGASIVLYLLAFSSLMYIAPDETNTYMKVAMFMSACPILLCVFTVLGACLAAANEK